MARLNLLRQLTKVFRNARSWHGSQLFIEEEDRVCLGLRLGLRKRRNCGLDCCCHRNSSLLVDIGRQNRVRHMRHTYQRGTNRSIRTSSPLAVPTSAGCGR